MIPLTSGVVRFTEAESRKVLSRDRSKRELRGYYLMGTKCQFGKMKKVLEMDAGDGCMTM